MAVAATGDPSLAEAEGRVVAREARLVGVNQISAPDRGRERRCRQSGHQRAQLRRGSGGGQQVRRRRSSAACRRSMCSRRPSTFRDMATRMSTRIARCRFCCRSRAAGSRRTAAVPRRDRCRREVDHDRAPRRSRARRRARAGAASGRGRESVRDGGVRGAAERDDAGDDVEEDRRRTAAARA